MWHFSSLRNSTKRGNQLQRLITKPCDINRRVPLVASLGTCSCELHSSCAESCVLQHLRTQAEGPDSIVLFVVLITLILLHKWRTLYAKKIHTRGTDISQFPRKNPSVYSLGVKQTGSRKQVIRSRVLSQAELSIFWELAQNLKEYKKVKKIKRKILVSKLVVRSKIFPSLILVNYIKGTVNVCRMDLLNINCSLYLQNNLVEYKERLISLPFMCENWVTKREVMFMMPTWSDKNWTWNPLGQDSTWQ